MASVPEVAARRSPASAVNSRVLGGLLFVFGSGWLLKQTGVIDMPWSAVTSLVLIALGLAMIVTARSRARTVPLMLVGIALTAGLAVSSSNIDIKGGIGDRNIVPTVLEHTNRYHLGIGDMTIDLRRVNIPDGETTLRADVGVGHLQVRVPADVALRVDVDTRMGNARVLDHQMDVHGRGNDTLRTEGYEGATKKLHLVLKAGVGQIDVING